MRLAILLFSVSLAAQTLPPLEKHEQEERIRQRRKHAAVYRNDCPKRPPAEIGIYCIAFSRPNDDWSENLRSPIGIYETARFVTSLKVDPKAPEAMELDVLIDPLLHQATAATQSILNLTNDFGGAKVGSKLRKEGKNVRAKIDLGKLPKRDGKYSGEVAIGWGTRMALARLGLENSH